MVHKTVTIIARTLSLFGRAKIMATAGNILMMAPSAIANPARQLRPRSRQTKAAIMSPATRALLWEDCSERSVGRATRICAAAHCSRSRTALNEKKMASALTAFQKKRPRTNGMTAKGAKSNANEGEYLK